VLRREEGKGMEDRAFASATELSDEIRDRHIGCVELLDFYLARAERHNPRAPDRNFIFTS
jgi:Asp-tRNA(Asn)/Glu-tRNA(Gln) amidotransferase A subunit family amidase